MKLKLPSPEWIKKAMLLSKDEAERTLSRMPKKLSRRLGHEEIDPLHAVALQLQLEDEHLQEWRDNLAKLREQAASSSG